MIGWPIFQFLSYPISFLMPGYLSFKAVLTEFTDDDTHWLSYWLIVAFIFLFESAFSIIVNSFPFYYEMKCTLLLFLQWNTADKSFRFYKHFFEPLFKYYEPKIDEFLSKYSQTATFFLQKVRNVANDQIIKLAESEMRNKINE